MLSKWQQQNMWISFYNVIWGKASRIFFAKYIYKKWNCACISFFVSQQFLSLTVTQITRNGILYTNSNVWKKRNWIFRENSVVNWYSDKTKHCMMFAFIKLFMCKTNSVTSDVVNEQTKSHKFSIKHCKRDGKMGRRGDEKTGWGN